MGQKKDQRGRTGSHSARPLKGRGFSITEPFIAHRRAMIESAAMAFVSPAARRCLDRLELEHLDHAGKENGRLIVTYDDFARFGIRKASISAALDQLEEVGFLRVTERGRGGNAEFRRASKYRLTYLPANNMEPTDEWAKWTPPHSPQAEI